MNFITHVMPCHGHGHTCNNNACVNIKLRCQCKKARAWEYYGEKTCFIDTLISYKLHKINSEGVLVQCEPKLGFGLTKDSHGLITTQALIRKNTHVHSASTTFHGPFVQTAKKSQNPTDNWDI